MDKAKRKHSDIILRRYWRIFIPLSIILALFIKFPLRILLWEMTWDIVMYGAVSLICLFVARRVYRRYHSTARELITVIVLCACLSAFQVIDLAVLRSHTTPTAYFGFSYEDVPQHIGYAWYGPRFRNETIFCHSIVEIYNGNDYIAITTDILHQDFRLTVSERFRVVQNLAI